GFVKIFGEDPDDESLNGPDRERSMAAKPKRIQALVLVAGVACNVLFAWLLISIGYMIGLPTPSAHDGPGVVQNEKLMITIVSPDSPASKADLKPGDEIAALTSEDKYALDELTPSAVSNFIEAHGKEGLTFTVKRGNEEV